MPAVSRKQRRFFGIVEAIKKGNLSSSYSKKAAETARSMKAKAIKHFASTSEKGLPKKAGPTLQGAAQQILKRRKQTDKRAREILGK